LGCRGEEEEDAEEEVVEVEEEEEGVNHCHAIREIILPSTPNSLVLLHPPPPACPIPLPPNALHLHGAVADPVLADGGGQHDALVQVVEPDFGFWAQSLGLRAEGSELRAHSLGLRA